MSSHRQSIITSASTWSLVLGLATWLVAVMAPKPVSGQAACRSNPDCAATDQACVSRFCEDNFNLTFSPTTVTASGYSQGVGSDSIGNFILYHCLGGKSICSAQPTTNTAFWTKRTGADSYSVTRSNLRPSRTYSTTYIGEVNTVRTDYEARQVTTLPGYQPTATVSGITENSATVSWTTRFLSDSTIWYGLTEPDVSVEQTVVSPEVFTDVDALSSGEAWAVTSSGRAFRRNTSGAWSEALTGEGYFDSVSVFDAQHIWLGANAGKVLYTTDGGSSWVRTTFGAPSDDIFDLYAPTATTAWAVSRNKKISLLDQAVDPNNWQLKYTATFTMSDIYSLDNKEIWAVGSGGRIVTSRDGGATWSETLVTSSGASLGTITTVDGRTLWVGGSTGSIYRSNDSGVSWSPIATGSVTAIDELTPINTLAIWFTQSDRLGYYDATGAPSFTFYTQARADLGSPLTELGQINGGQMFLASDNGRLGLFRQAGSVHTDLPLVTNHSHTFPPGSLVPGTDYFFSVISSDGNISAGAFGTFRTLEPDPVPPDISFAPDPPAYTNVSPLTVSGTATDNISLQSVTVTNNGAPQVVTTAPPLPGPASTSWSSTKGLNVGSNPFKATATDSSGNTKTVTATVFYDPNPPVVAITNPSDGAVVATSTITIDGTANDDDWVDSMEYVLNGGPRKPLTITPGAGVNWSDNAGPLTPGANTLTVYAKDRAGNEGSQTVNFEYREPTFTLSADPIAAAGNAGDVFTFSITATSVDGFADGVTFSVSGEPAGSSVTFAPNPLLVPAGGSDSSTMTMTTNPATTGTFDITITGTSGPKTATTSVSLKLRTPPDFTLSAIPVIQNIVAGNPTSYQITANSNVSFNDTVTFSVSGLPALATSGFSPGSLTLPPSSSGTTDLTVTTQPATPDGSYTLTITGTSPGLTRTVNVTLNISAPPDFSLTVVPAGQTVTAGGSTSYNGTVKALNGFAEPVNVTATINPPTPEVTLSIAPNRFTPTPGGTSFIANVQTTGATPSDTYAITVKVENDAATISHTVDVSLQVDADVTPPIITNISATPNWDSVRVTWETNELADSELAIYADAGLGTLVGIVSDAGYCLSGCHDLFYTPLNPTTTYYFTVTSADQAVPTPNSTTRTKEDDGVTPLQFTTLDEPDSMPPSVVIDEPADGDILSGSATIRGTATDNKNVTQVRVTIAPVGDPDSFVLDQNLLCAGASCSFNTIWNTTAVPNDSYLITAVARDTAGNLSTPTSISVAVENDFTPPLLTCDVTPTPTPTGGEVDCGGGQCWEAVITWCTDDPSTSEVDFGTSVSCGGGVCTYPLGQRYDDLAPADPSPIYTNHRVTLRRLDANQLYHYRITSCNEGGFCTH